MRFLCLALLMFWGGFLPILAGNDAFYINKTAAGRPLYRIEHPNSDCSNDVGG